MSLYWRYCNPSYLLLSVTGLKIETQRAEWWPTTWRGVLGVTAAHPGWWISLYVNPLQWIIISCCEAVWQVEMSPPTSPLCLLNKNRALTRPLHSNQRHMMAIRGPQGTWRRDSQCHFIQTLMVPEVSLSAADKSHKYDLTVLFYLSSLMTMKVFPLWLHCGHSSAETIPHSTKIFFLV